MATIGTITAALQLVDGKKETLRKAFEDLQLQSHLLSSFNLSWSDLDSHFSSLQSSLKDRFKLLQSIKPQSKSPEQRRLSSAVPARPELKSLCEKMDGVGLLRYLYERRFDRTAIKVELTDAYRSAPDAADMVLNAVEKFYSTDKDLNLDLDSMRRNCVGMLEDMLEIKPEISAEVREKAMKLAVQWKKNITRLHEEDKPLGTLGFLHLVAVYNLAGFDMDELIDYVIAISKRRQANYLCRALISDDRIPDLIQKLIDDDKKLVAVKFICEFKQTDKFPPVPLLKEYRQESRKQFAELRNNGKGSLRVLNEVKAKEISSLRSIIKCIEDYHLESGYPKHNLMTIIEKLEKENTNKKRVAPTPVPKPENLRTSKLYRTAAPKSDPNVFILRQPQVQASGLLLDRIAPSVNLNQAGHYAGTGAHHAIQYARSHASPYGYVGPLGFNGNSTSTGPNLYPPEQHNAGGPSGFNGNSTSRGPNLYPSELHTGGPSGFNGNSTSTGPNLYPSEVHNTGGSSGFSGSSISNVADFYSSVQHATAGPGFNSNPTSNAPGLYPSVQHATGGPLGFDGNSTSTGPNLYPSDQKILGGPGFNGNSTATAPNLYPSQLLITGGLGFNGNSNSTAPNLNPSEQHITEGVSGFNGDPAATAPNLYPSEQQFTGRPGFNGNSIATAPKLYSSEQHITGGASGFNGSSTSVAPNLYPPEQHPPSSGYYYNMPVQYDGYNLQPQYNQRNYPQ